MTARSLNYYGFSRESYIECSSLIRTTNRKHITILNTWFLLINLLYLVFSSLNLFGVSIESIPFYMIYFAISIILEGWLIISPRSIETHNNLAVFISLIILLSYGIIASFMQPYMPATMFLVLFVLTSLSYITNMVTMIVFSTIAVSFFLWTSYSFKTFSIAYHDTYNIIVITTLATTLHYTFQRTRISQFILYQKDLHIQRELEIKSSFDSLTGLLNRERFFSITEQILRLKNTEYITLCLMDLDGFKQINDNLGHQMGDKVIQTAGRLILKSLFIEDVINTTISDWDLSKPVNLAGRLGGDEFILLIQGLKSQNEVKDFLQELLSSLNKVQFEGLNGIHASFGVTEFSQSDKDIDNGYKRADEALYESKRAGKNQIHFNTKTLTGDA